MYTNHTFLLSNYSSCNPNTPCPNPLPIKTGIIFKGKVSNQNPNDTAIINTSIFGPDGNYYVGGDFLTVEGINCYGIAKWDGIQWSPVAGGFNNAVNALAFDTYNNLYAGGAFTASADGTTPLLAVAILRQNSTSWQSVGTLAQSQYTSPFIKCTVYALCPDPAGNIYIGGDFIYINNSLTAQYGLAVTNACGTLSSLCGGVTVATSGTTSVNALTFRRNTLFIGGNFAGIQSTVSANLVAINLLTFPPTPFAVNTTGATSIVSSLTTDSQNVYVGTNSGSALYAGGSSSVAYINFYTAGLPLVDVKDSNGNYIPVSTALSTTRILNLAIGNCALLICGCFNKATGGTGTVLANTDVVLYNFAVYQSNTFDSDCIPSNNGITSIAVDAIGDIYLTYIYGAGSGIIKILKE